MCGGSAGGVNAFIRLLEGVLGDMAVAIVIVNHLRSVLTQLYEIRPRHTTLPVDLVTDLFASSPSPSHDDSGMSLPPRKQARLVHAAEASPALPGESSSITSRPLSFGTPWTGDREGLTASPLRVLLSSPGRDIPDNTCE